MIDRIRAFAEFWYDFIIGDDWRIAAGIVGALATTLVLNRTTEAAVWWIVAAAVAALLPLSIYRITRHRGDPQPVSSSST